MAFYNIHRIGFINNCVRFNLAQRDQEQLRHIVLWWSIQGATIDKTYSVKLKYRLISWEVFPGNLTAGPVRVLINNLTLRLFLICKDWQGVGKRSVRMFLESSKQLVRITPSLGFVCHFVHVQLPCF